MARWLAVIIGAVVATALALSVAFFARAKQPGA